MTSETALRKWLHREDKTDIQNIEFGMKVWNSIEFNLLTKHEIIIEECCKILLKLSAKLTTSQDIHAWSVINEFLALKCSPGAVVSSVKLTLLTTLSDVVRSMKCHHYIVYKGLITLLQNSYMQSFFKSNSKPFAMFVGTTITYLANLIESNDVDSGFDHNDPLIHEVVKITKSHIKQTPYLKEFRKPFVKYLLLPLSELFISLREHGIIDESDYFNVLHEIYFADNENQSPMNQLLLQPENENFKFLLNVPVHVFMLIIESIFQPLKVDTATQALFIQYLFNVYFKQSNEKFANEKQMLVMLSLFLSLLKRNDVPLNFDIDGVAAVVYMGKNIESLNITESNLFEVLLVLCASIELNPMMLEQSIISIVVKCMLHRKDDRTIEMFERFLILVIDMYRRLSRSEKFMSNLIRSMWQKLSEFKLSKKFKRKIGTGDVNISVDESSPKRMRLLDADGNSSTVSINGSMKDETNKSQWFLQLLQQHINPPDVQIIDSSGNGQMLQWKNIQFAWPNRVGETFSKFISGLVSKPSLVVWKTLVFTLTDYIKLLKQGDSSENTLFLVDWISALLCQYFDGCRLAEQSDKTWEMIDNNRKLQRNLLKDFGSAILSQEHNIRTMNAFLSLCHSSGNFDLLSWFYCPDSITTNQIDCSMADNSNDFVHSYLQPTEWVLIEQRITNFGKEECRTNLNRLNLQKIKSKLMFKESNETIDMANHLLASTLDDDDGLKELNEILMDETTNQWFIQQLTRPQKIQTARRIVELDCDNASNNYLSSKLVNGIQDQEFFDILTVAVFERIGMEAKDPTFVLKRINFDDVFAGNESVCKELVRGMKKSSLGSDEQSPTALKLLEVLPIGFVSLSAKNILLHLTLSLLGYTSGVDNRSSFKYLIKLLLHGDTPDVFRHLKVKLLPSIIDNNPDVSENDLELLFKLVFEKNLIELTPSTSKMLDELLALLKTETFENKQCSYVDMAIRLLDYLNKNKKCKEFSTQYRNVILEKILEFFDEKIVHSPDDTQHFVSKTAAGFVHIISTMTEFDDQIKRIINIYVQNMQNCYDAHSIKLLNIVVTNKTIFGYSDSDISEVIIKFWNILVNDLDNIENPDVYQSFVKFFINFKSSEELIDLLTAMNSENADTEDVIRKFKKFEKLFRLIFKCQMNKTKGIICSEFFRQISFQIVIKLRTLPETQSNIRHQLLECQKQLCTNIQISVSTDLIDDIISFMSETIKYQQIKTVTNASTLKETHSRISDLCYTLIQHRHFFIVDRIPQFVIILKELLQSVCWYKCTRIHGKHLDDDEVTILAELAHKLENIIKAFVKHAKEVKRIAPYFLLFIMNLLISKENVSTIYPKIKTHFDYICYDLIAVCDHRVEGFIMRNCNEASKQLYETMVKEYNKYHKFRGKV